MFRVLTLFWISILGSTLQAQNLTERLDSIVSISVFENRFEGTILVAREGKSIYHQSFGYADDGRNIPLNNATHFGIASITKMLTAICILQLVEEEKFELDNTLQTLLPEYDIPNSKKISVHHLLLHISGLPNERDALYLQSRTPEEFVTRTLRNKSNRFGQFNYANIDYVLLGILIEKFDKSAWEESVRNRILNKVGMTESGFLSKDNYPEDFAYTFSYGGSDIREADPLFHIENFYASGCMHSTAEDLLKLDQAMYGELLLSAESKELMYTSYPEFNYTGYSVWTYTYPFADSYPRVMERRGGILGSNSTLLRLLSSNGTIIILSNNDQFNPDSFGETQSLKEALLIELAGEK